MLPAATGALLRLQSARPKVMHGQAQLASTRSSVQFLGFVTKNGLPSSLISQGISKLRTGKGAVLARSVQEDGVPLNSHAIELELGQQQDKMQNGHVAQEASQEADQPSHASDEPNKPSILSSPALDVSPRATQQDSQPNSPIIAVAASARVADLQQQHLEHPTTVLPAEHDRAALLDRPITTPTTSRKVQAIKDLALCTLAFIPYAFMTALRFILSRFGLTEHRWKGVPNDQPLTAAGRKHLLDIASGLEANNSDVQSLLSGSIQTSSNSSNTAGLTMKPQASMASAISNHLQDIFKAMEDVAAQHNLPLHEYGHRSKVNKKLARVVRRMSGWSAVNPQDALKQLRHHAKSGIKSLARQVPGLRPSQVASDFTFRCLMRHSLRVPTIQHHALIQLDSNTDTPGIELLESSSLISLQPGLEYLKLQGEGFEEQAGFLAEYSRLRPSDVKNEWLAQGMTINGRVHSLHIKYKDGSVKELASYLRSGAYAVHGRKPKGWGLSSLITAQQLLAAEDSIETRRELLERFGVSSAAALAPEIRFRSVMCVAQALPVVVAGLQKAVQKRSCWESAVRAGSWLHIQQSLLSDLNTNEHSYLQDTKGALDLLVSRLEIRFAPRPLSQLSLDSVTQRITLTLDSSVIPDDVLPLQTFKQIHPADASSQDPRTALLNRSYRFQSALFSQGLNLSQSLGFLTISDQEATLQDTLNLEALQSINQYALAAGKEGGPALTALNAHYGSAGKRHAKDTHSIMLVRMAAHELGAMRAVNCKSGKDRTAIELSISCSRYAVEAGVLPPEHEIVLRSAMQAGLSYSTTTENNGQPSAYAFSELELACLPPSWRPSWHLCGKVMS